jgi:riboflavin kinase/FMN adenylyltransferase
VYGTDKLSPREAVYGVASLGVRPTMHKDGKPVLEVHLFDFEREIYGCHLRVDFLHKLRDEEKYPDLATLTRQIGRDVENAKNYFLELPSLVN